MGRWGAGTIDARSVRILGSLPDDPPTSRRLVHRVSAGGALESAKGQDPKEAREGMSGL
jgi:hypothetical protein